MIKLSESERKEIQQLVEKRGIRRLLHFTRVENLASIFEKGLVPQNDISVTRKLNNTVDGNKDCVCLSISHPSKMFFPMRKDDPPDSNWCVIVLKPEVMWERTCRFTAINAVSNILKNQKDETFYGADALENMFDETVTNPKGEIENRADYLRDNMVTNPQAEIRVHGEIEPDYFTAVHFHKDFDAENLANFSWPQHIQRMRSKWFFNNLNHVMMSSMKEPYLQWLNDPSS